MKKCFIYGRVSSERIIDGKDSIIGQIKQLKQFAKKSNLKVEKVFTDRCTNSDRERPGLIRLLQEVASGKVKTILCQDYTRLAPSFSDWPVIKWMLKKQGVKIITPLGDTKEEQAFEELVSDIMAVVKMFDHKAHSERIKRSLRLKKQQPL